MFKSVILCLPLLCVVLAAPSLNDVALNYQTHQNEFISDELALETPPVVSVAEDELGELMGLRNHSKFYGERVAGDEWIFQADAKITFDKLALGCKGCSTLDIEFARDGNEHNLNATITYMAAIDRKANYQGGWVWNIKGGIGEKYAVMRFMAHLTHPLDFEFSIYGIRHR